ncbi:hypothetical protein CMI47_09430 [Candidatus Pacearchaeota archaeon]|nr:hypothetical protein [Candidatus Pacearchaeota archaeon]
MSLSPYASYLPEFEDPDADLFGLGEYDDFADEDDFGAGGLDDEIAELLAEEEIDEWEEMMGDDEDDDESDFADLEADLDSMGLDDEFGEDQFGVRLSQVPYLETSKLKKLITGRWRRKKIRKAALEELLRRKAAAARGQSTQTRQATSYAQPVYYSTPTVYAQPQQSGWYRRRRRRRGAGRHPTGEIRTVTPQAEVARQQAAARAITEATRRQQRQAARQQRQASRPQIQAENARRQRVAARKRAAAQRNQQRQQAAGWRRVRERKAERAQRQHFERTHSRIGPPPGLVSQSNVQRDARLRRGIIRFGEDGAPAGFELKPKLGSAMWAHPFKTFLVLGGVYAVGAYVGKERTMDALGPVGDQMERLGARLRAARVGA